MRTVAIIIIVGVILAALTILSEYKFRLRFGSLEGFVFLEQTEKKVIPLQGLQVFLILGDVGEKLKIMEQQYQMEIVPLEASVGPRLKDYELARGRVEQLISSLNPGNSLIRDPLLAAQQENRLAQLKEQRDSLYYRYQEVKERYDKMQLEFNSRLADLINKYSYMQSGTNDKGRYRFPRVEKRAYYIFTEYRTFVEHNTWFVPVTITKKGQRINLSRTNLAHIFK